MLTDVELGPDGEYYIRRKLNSAELESLRRLSTGSDSNNQTKIFVKPKTRSAKGQSSYQLDYPPPNRRQLNYRHPPFFITFISIFELVSFVYYALRSDEPLSLLGPVPHESKLIYNPHRRYEIWRYLTYVFIHAGYWHISFNLLIQLAVGIPLELVHKFEPVFIIYVGGVLGGSLGNSLADPHSYLAGASSGCYALITAHISNLIINWSEIKGACCRLLGLLIFTSYDLGTAIYERHIKISITGHKMSYGGHLAGAASGLLLGIICLRNVRVLGWEREAKKWAITIYMTAVVSRMVELGDNQASFCCRNDKLKLTSLNLDSFSPSYSTSRTHHTFHLQTIAI